MQVSQVLPHQTGKIISLRRWLCAREHCQVETGKRQTQNITTKLAEISLYVVALRVPFIGNKAHGPTYLWPYSAFIKL